MEGGGKDAREEPVYVTTTADDSPGGDTLHIQVDMADDERGGGGGGGGVWRIQDEVSTVATRLRHLDDIGNREDFHRQCCDVSCCTAKQVIRIMRSGSYRVPLVQIASEIFLLQNLLNPTHYNCTEELLDSWLSVQEEKDEGPNAILENVNKMVALVESVEHLVIFLRSLLKRFGTQFLGLCSDLALRALKQQRHLAAGEGNGEMIDGTARERLSQTLDLVGQMFFDSHRQIYLACHLSALYVDRTERRFSALEVAFSNSSESTVDAASIPVNGDLLTDLWQTVNLFRPVELDPDLGWTKLKPLVTVLFFSCMVAGPQTSSCGFSAGVISDSLWTRTTTHLDGNEATRQMTTVDRGWRGVVNPFDCNTSSVFVEGKKPWSVGDASSALTATGQRWSTEYCGGGGVNETELGQVNGGRLQVNAEIPDSTSADLTMSSNSDGFKFRYIGGSNGLIESNGFGSIDRRTTEDWKGSGAWPATDSDDEASNPLNIASAEEEDVSSIAEEMTTFHGSSAFSKKRSASAEMMSSAQMVTEPCRKRRAVSVTRSKSIQEKEDDTEAEEDAAGVCKRTLRAKERCERSRVVTRKTFCFRYKYSSGFPSKLRAAEEVGKRSERDWKEIGMTLENDLNKSRRLERDLNKSRRLERDLNKSKISLPNGVKLRNCFIRLNRVRTDDEQSADNDPSESCGSTSLELEICSTPPTLKEESSAGCASSTFKEEESVGFTQLTIEDVRSCGPTHPREIAKPDEKQQEEEDIGVKVEEVFAAAAAEDKVVQCVCDGCGEIVPDCSWLTAHIVTCTGRPESGVADSMMDDELTDTFRSDGPIWEDAMAGNGCDGGLDAPTSQTDVDGGMLSMEPTNEMSAFPTHSPTDVDASNLMQQLMHASDVNQSSFIYDPSMTSETTAGVKVIQMSDGTSYSVTTQPSSVMDDAPDDQCGKEVLYNGVYMYEFTEYQCDLCLLTFASHSATAEHIRASDHSGSTVSRNTFCCCLKCSIRYREKHIMWHHALYLCASATDEQTDESRLYRCLLCSKAFLSGAFLRRHVCLQHGRQVLSAGHRQIGEDATVVRQLSGPASESSRIGNYGVGLDGQLLGTWNCFQVNESGSGVTTSMAQDENGGFSVAGPEAADEDQKAKPGAIVGTNSATSGEPGADSQALLDLACSIVLGGCSPPATNFPADGSSAPATASQPTPPAAVSSAPPPASASSQSTVATSSSTRRTAKGIMYKNVFMQCIVNYLCSTCKKDLSTKASKKEHKSSPCFDADSKRFTYLRQYSYLCPYCSEKFPSQKFCRQHQLSVCLQLMGVKTDELNHKQLLCPFCDRKYFNIITLKGHMTLIHKVNKVESSQILGTSGLLEELISFAPDAAGLSEKAKKAKQQTTAEEDRKHAEANRIHASALPPPPPATPKDPLPQTDALPAKDVSPANVKPEGGSKVDVEKNEAKPDPSGGGNVACSQLQPSKNESSDLENGASHDSGLESNAAEQSQALESDGFGKDVDRCELQIVEVADPEGMTFDGDASNDNTSTDDPSELDELSCETDSTLPTTNDLKESQMKEDEADGPLDAAAKKSTLKRKKSNKKTRRKVAAKTRKKLH